MTAQSSAKQTAFFPQTIIIEMFPNLDADVIEIVYNSNNCDQERTVAQLFELSEIEQTSKPDTKKNEQLQFDEQYALEIQAKERRGLQQHQQIQLRSNSKRDEQMQSDELYALEIQEKERLYLRQSQEEEFDGIGSHIKKGVEQAGVGISKGFESFKTFIKKVGDSIMKEDEIPRTEYDLPQGLPSSQDFLGDSDDLVGSPLKHDKGKAINKWDD